MGFEEFMGTRAVSDTSTLDVGRLDAWMKANVDGYLKLSGIEQFKGGQSNPTYLLRNPGRDYVMRRKPDGDLLPSAHAIDREFRVISALHGTDVPVARPHAYCADPSIAGTPFYIMDYVEGRVLWDPKLPGMTPAERAAHFDELGRVIAALHRVEPAAIGLSDYGREGNYVERQVNRWIRQYRSAETEKIEAMEGLIAWLPANLPDGDERRIVHGDYRIDNVIFHPVEPRILAVLDWELSTIGHPLADFAYHCMMWHRSLESGRGLSGLDLDALGLPSEATYRQSYLRRTGRSSIDPETWRYFLVFSMFRLAGITQGIRARALGGNAASPHAMKASSGVAALAEVAIALAVGKGS